jgi:hypothetical protein
MTSDGSPSDDQSGGQPPDDQTGDPPDGQPADGQPPDHQSSGGGQPVDQSSTGEARDQSSDGQAGDQSSDDQSSGNQSSDGQPGDQTAGDQSGDQASGNQSGDQPSDSQSAAQPSGVQGPGASSAGDPDQPYLIADQYPLDSGPRPPWGNLVATAGFCGVILKAWEGTQYNDMGWFKTSWSAVRDARGDRYGVSWFRGAYLFLRFAWNPSYTAQMVANGLQSWPLEDIVPWQYCGDNLSAAANLPHAVSG